jgi:ATP-dependent RNA helicase DeaD
MESFDEIDVAPELVEALAAEGIETPTPLQEGAIPLIRRGNNLVLAAGPGSGLLVAWLVPLLERLEEESGRVLVLTPSREAADGLAESASRIASTGGLAVSAIGSPWALPERAEIVFGTPADVLVKVGASELDLGGVRALVVDQAQHLERFGALGDVERVIDYIPAEAQRVVTALPVTAAVADFVERHCKRALTWPAAAPDP